MPLKFKTNNWWQVVLHLFIMAGIVMTIILVFFFVYLPNTTNHGESLTVPNLKGMNWQSAKKYAEERGLQLVVKDSVFKPNTQPLTVIEQNPLPDLQVKEGRKIYLVITPQQAPTVVLPQLVGLGFETAKTRLRKAGFIFGNLTYEPHLEKGNVLKVMLGGERVKEGTKLPQGATLDLVVGGDVAESFDVPKLIGLTQEEAEAVIKASDLEVGVVKYVFNSEEPLGTVVKQYPEARREIVDGKMQNSQIKAGEIMDIWVVGSPEAEPVLENELLPDSTND